jgi:2-methylaconitate cis-trans-isomerase PrpF
MVPFGVGKTTTVECIAKDSKVPIYIVSASELGTDVGESPQEITTRVKAWNAISVLRDAESLLKCTNYSPLASSKLYFLVIFIFVNSSMTKYIS